MKDLIIVFEVKCNEMPPKMREDYVKNMKDILLKQLPKVGFNITILAIASEKTSIYNLYSD